MEEHNLPQFELPDAHGAPWSPAGLRQRQEMLIALTHGPGCEGCRPMLQLLTDELRGRDLGSAAIVALTPQASEPPPEAQFAMLYDEGGRAAEKIARAMGLAPGEAALVISDRYGAGYLARPLHGADREVIIDALETLDFIQRQCPECGVPTW